MKKVTVLAAAIAIIGFASVEANAQVQGQGQQGQQTQTQTQQTEQPQQQGNREKLTRDQLPEGVQNALNNEVYANWTVGDIHKVSPMEGAASSEIVYEIQMTNAEGQSGVVRMNEKGGAASSGQDQE